ncbi:hypothetical protein [Burkholderia lata]|uniref:hypothetical protein n=1 Tax=Burkholderia lata (strain ATCC 17760 / DSM 23089 / LMG 22485 / NCIMB 9086 / R18194 / 383) TaxID=482957 RepID=UPI0020C66A81|nr:hypothetical protein [Burkholderia lata]
MSLVTSPLSAVVTGNAVELMCCPGTTVHAESIATVAKESAMHMPRTAVRVWPGATESNGRTFFIFVSSSDESIDTLSGSNSGRSSRARFVPNIVMTLPGGIQAPGNRRVFRRGIASESNCQKPAMTEGRRRARPGT